MVCRQFKKVLFQSQHSGDRRPQSRGLGAGCEDLPLQLNTCPGQRPGKPRKPSATPVSRSGCGHSGALEGWGASRLGRSCRLPCRGSCGPQNSEVLLQDSGARISPAGRCKPTCPPLPSSTSALSLEGWLLSESPGGRTKKQASGREPCWEPRAGHSPSLGPANSETSEGVCEGCWRGVKRWRGQRLLGEREP